MNTKMEKVKKKGFRAVAIAIILIVVIANTPPVQYFLLEQYSYQNKDESFTYQEVPGQALDFEVCQIRWERFKNQYPQADHILYRNFTIKPWQFWEWWQFVAHPQRYRLPYLPN